MTTLPTHHPIARALEHAELRHRLASAYGPHAQASTAAQVRRAKLAYDATLALHPPGLLAMPLPALPRPPQPTPTKAEP